MPPTGLHEPIAPTEAGRTGGALTRPQWVVLIGVGIVEIVSALYIAHINPVSGYDENSYLINAWRFQGHDNLPYADHRPPLLSLLLAVAGRHHDLVPALSHVGGWLLTFLILRRMTTTWPAIAGSALFMLMPELRMYNLMLLTEGPSILLFLLAVWLYLDRRPALCGVAVTSLALSHWSMLIVPPVFFAAFALRDGRQAGFRCAGWSAAALLPFLAWSAIAYGNPLYPVLAHLRFQPSYTNNWLFYVRCLEPTWIPWLCGTALAAWWVSRAHRRGVARSLTAPLLLLLVLVESRFGLLHLIAVKGHRYVAPILPLMLILTVCAVWRFERIGRGGRTLAWCVMVWAILPTRYFVWSLYDCRFDPAHQIAAFETIASEIGLREPVYTDINDLAVMGLLHRPAVAVTGEGSWHHDLLARRSCEREAIPLGSWYLTWNPGGGEIVTSRKGSGRRALHLVRWRGDGNGARTHLQNESASTDNQAGSAPAGPPVSKPIPSQRR